MPTIDFAPRLAASTYLNSAPLLWSFTRGTQQGTVNLVEAVPAACADQLRNESVDAALIPVIEYQRIAGGVIVPNVCVGSRQRVRSVLLVTKKDNPRELTKIALDQSSRTSAALLRIIYREFLGFEPAWNPQSPDLIRMLQENDGALIIGDPAMAFAREDFRIFDLASLWHEHTGLGFVFAMWMIRDGASRAAYSIDFAGARDEGLAKSEEILDSYGPAFNLSRDELRTYLTDNISFKLSDAMQSGMELYFKLAFEHGLIPELKPLSYLE